MSSMPHSLNILVIDDDKFSQKFIKKSLQNKHAMTSAFDGEQGLMMAEDSHPDIIILDVEMPGMNGYEVCEKMKQRESTNQIPVIFLSSNGTTRSRMQGYEVGADDYLVKPFERDDLLAKINVLHNYRIKQNSLEEQIESATKTAFTAMTGTNELAQALTYIESCHTSNNYDSLSKKLFSLLRSFSLRASLLVKSSEEVLYFADNKNVAPLESELMLKLHIQKRFIDFGCRTQINYPNCALLIKNMPLGDSARYGSIKDLLPVILSATDTKVASLNSQSEVQEQNTRLIQSFDLFNSTLTKLGKQLTSNQKAGSKILQSMVNTLTERLPTLGLEEDQEVFLLNTIDNAILETMDLIGNCTQVDKIFELVLTKHAQILEKQKELLEANEHSVKAGDDNDDSLAMDVELF